MYRLWPASDKVMTLFADFEGPYVDHGPLAVCCSPVQTIVREYGVAPLSSRVAAC